MQTSNGDQKVKSNTQVWYLLGEYSLSEMIADKGNGDHLTAGFVFQPCRELGVPPEWIGNIEKTLTGFAKKAQAPFQPGRLERSGSIRVFCQKKLIDEAKSARNARPEQAEQTMEPAPSRDHSSTTMIGGWGYFIIERSRGSAGPAERSHPFVDLYLYKEGE